MDRLAGLESQSVYILREAYREFKTASQLVMLWSIGKDSTVLLWLARKAFFGHVPFPLMHIDTHHKIPEMIAYRDRFAMQWKLHMIVGQHEAALAEKRTFPAGNATRLQCCAALKTEALKNTLSGVWPRWVLDHETGQYVKTSVYRRDRRRPGRRGRQPIEGAIFLAARQAERVGRGRPAA